MIDLPAPRRDRVVAGVLVGAAVLFVAVWIPRTSSVGFAGALTVPLVLLLADLVIAAALLTRWYPVRPVAQGLAAFGVLVHVLVALRSGPPVARGCAAVLAVAHAWLGVSLIMLTAAEDEAAEDEADTAQEADTVRNDALPGEPEAGAPPRDDTPRAVEITGQFRIEVPITDVVDLDPPVHDPAADPTPEPPVTQQEQEERTR